MAYDPTVQSDYDPTMAAMSAQPTGPADLARFGITDALIRSNPNMQAAGITNIQQFWDRYQQGNVPNFGLAKDSPLGDLIKYGIIGAGAAGLMGALPGTTSLFGGGAAAGATPAQVLSGTVTGGGGVGAGATGAFSFPGSEFLASSLTPDLGGAAAGGVGAFGGAGAPAWADLSTAATGMEGVGYAGGGFTPPAVAEAGGGGGNWFTNLLSGLTGGKGSGTSDFGPASLIGGLGSLASGIYGMGQADKIRQAGEAAARMQDPFGPYRPQYAQQLSNLLANPSLVTQIPGYQAGLEAVQRGQAAGGYLGSGNEMAALQQYGGQFYQQQLSNLMQLSGAGISPSGGQYLLGGATGGAQQAGASLGSMGYGAMLPFLASAMSGRTGG